MSQPLLSKSRKVGNLIYTSGVTGKPGDPPTQIRNVFQKLDGILKEAGCSFANVVKVNVYLADLSHREKYLNDTWREFFPANPPARTTVQAGLDEGIYVEIEMVAAADH
jgi:2-iminobutanoate/2-iminopropanoate deaminase